MGRRSRPRIQRERRFGSLWLKEGSWLVVVAFDPRNRSSSRGGDEQKRRGRAACIAHALFPLSLFFPFLSFPLRLRRRNGRRTIQSTADCKNKRDPVFSLHFDLRRGLWLLSISGRRRRRRRRGKPISRNAPVRCTVSLSRFFLSFS